MPPVSITNARIFDGDKIARPEDQEVITIDETGLISGGLVGSTIDGKGMTLLPGLWDTHVHLSTPEGPALSTAKSIPLLNNMIRCGITTAIDCGRMDREQYDSIRARDDLPDVRFAGNFATSTGSIHSKFLMADKESLVDDVEAATEFVNQRIKQGAQYIKIVADTPGPSQEVVNQLSQEARAHGKLSIVHAARKTAWDMALNAEPKVDIITHVPMDEPLTAEDAAKMARLEVVSVPTLVMSSALCNSGFRPEYKMSVAIESVKQLHRAGVTILVGTDSNQSPIGVKHGESLFREMELLGEAGMTNEEILKAATSLSAKSFQIPDRGTIAPGQRADLILVDGDPVMDLQALRNVRKAWKAGREVFSV
ncbi:amidohydrolase [Lophiotrema nucula]|uniref:Amidohydrolase n=1 Tax=Lophiotrema nucula TaxID=690887 RepID=A0A6A5ZG36_9PLEO|nr:amidohydrolase [Lophiotrema nucula]